MIKSKLVFYASAEKNNAIKEKSYEKLQKYSTIKKNAIVLITFARLITIQTKVVTKSTTNTIH